MYLCGSTLSGYFLAVKKVFKSASVQIIEQILEILIIIFLFNNFSSSNMDLIILFLILSMVISQIISFLLLYTIYIFDEKNLKFTRKINTNISKKILSISMPVAITTYIKSFLSSLKHILIPLSLQRYGLSSTESLSLYGTINGMVFPVILFPNILITGFAGLLVPEFAYSKTKGEKKHITYMIKKVVYYTVIFSIIIAIFLVLFAPQINDVFYSGKHISKDIIILAPIILFMYLDTAVDSMLKGLDKQVNVMKINIFDLITTICLIIFILPITGKSGYIVILYISEILNCVLSIKALKNY